MKHLRIITMITLTLLLWASPAVAQDTTTKRRPDKTEFVTESQVRLTTESLTVAEISAATPPAQANPSFWDLVVQSWQDFANAIKSLFK